MVAYVALNKQFDTSGGYVKPETQSYFTVKNADGTTATTPTSSSSGGGPQSGTITVTTTAQPLVVAGRRAGSNDVIQLENTDDSATSVFFGPKATVTGTGATRGHELNPGDTADWSIGNNGASIYVVTATGTATLVWSVL